MKIVFASILFVTFVVAQAKRVSNNAIGSKACQVGWKEIHERIEYTPGSGLRVLFPDAELQLCDSPCETKNVSVRLTLATNHIGKGCDRDTYSVESQRKLCGASAESVDLLPTPGLGSEWTRDLPTDEGRESDQIYEFDGNTNAVVVPESTLNHNLSSKFTISFWMKHEPPGNEFGDSRSGSGSNAKHIKEHILCNADDHKKNRHHYALFVRNCRLVLLLRQESLFESKHTIFKPAEWRWKLSQVCDNEWHHYSVSVDFPDVTLYIDGQMFKDTLITGDGNHGTSNPEIVDDWPLHSVRGVNTTLVVGACWEGRDSKMSHHFRGYLAGLSVLRGRNENPDVLSCLHRCKEGLQLPPSDTLDPGTDVSVNSEATTVLIEGKDSIDVEDILSQISYLNSREFPTPGRRSLRISTSIRCINGKSIKVPSVYSYVVVLPPEQPSITLNGTANIGHDYESFIQGIDLFSTVTISMNHEIEKDEGTTTGTNGNSNNNNNNNNGNGNKDSSKSNDEDSDPNSSSQEDTDESNGQRTSSSSSPNTEHKLDACTVQVYPPLNSDHEFFKLPVNFMDHLGVHYKQTKDGVVIHGADSVKSYQSIIRQIIYFNRKPAYYLNRAFKLSCSELNGRFVSNEYIQTLTVIHPKGPSAGGKVNLPGDDSTGQAMSSSSSSSSSLSDARTQFTQQQAPSTSGNGNHLPVTNNGHQSQLINSVNSIHHQQQLIQHESPIQAKVQIQKQKVELKESHIRPASVNSFMHPSTSSLGNSHPSPIVIGHAVTVIVVVCVGFLIFMVVLGVIRIRAAHHRTSELGLNGRNGCNGGDDEPEMAWDDTALTITVNPLEQLVDHESNESNCIDDDEDDSSSSTSYHEEEGDSTEDEDAVEVAVTSSKSHPKGSTTASASMTWDDSALNF